jgi:hypothetical protein
MNEAPAHRPMTFTFLELLDRTFRLYRENFLTIVGLVAVVSIPIGIITYILAPPTSNLLVGQSPAVARTSINSGAQIITNLLGLIQTILIGAPITYIASEYLFNHKVSIGEAFSSTRHRFAKMGCGMILLVIFAVAIALFAIFLVALIPPALALLGIPIYILIAAISVIYQVLTLEDIGSSAAIARSYTLGKRRFWTVMGLILITYIIFAIFEAILGGSVTVLITSTTSAQNFNTRLLLSTFGLRFIGLFTAPISPIAFTLLYYDIRTRSEGLDIMLDSSGNPAARPSDFASPKSGFRIDGHDWRNIAILTAVGLITGILASGIIKPFVDQFSRNLR